MTNILSLRLPAVLSPIALATGETGREPLAKAKAKTRNPVVNNGYYKGDVFHHGDTENMEKSGGNLNQGETAVPLNAVKH